MLSTFQNLPSTLGRKPATSWRNSTENCETNIRVGKMRSLQPKGINRWPENLIHSPDSRLQTRISLKLYTRIERFLVSLTFAPYTSKEVQYFVTICFSINLSINTGWFPRKLKRRWQILECRRHSRASWSPGRSKEIFCNIFWGWSWVKVRKLREPQWAKMKALMRQPGQEACLSLLSFYVRGDIYGRYSTRLNQEWSWLQIRILDNR